MDNSFSRVTATQFLASGVWTALALVAALGALGFALVPGFRPLCTVAAEAGPAAEAALRLDGSVSLGCYSKSCAASRRVPPLQDPHLLRRPWGVLRPRRLPPRHPLEFVLHNGKSYLADFAPRLAREILK